MENKKGIYGRLHLRKTDKTLSKGEYVVVYFPEARIEHVTERIENTLGHGQRGSILLHVGTNNADRGQIEQCSDTDIW